MNKGEMNKGMCTKIRIGEKLQSWKARKGYLETSVTLMQVCEELDVNRTYMSNFINDKYHKNFNSWINELRVKESIRMMRYNPHIPLNIIGKRIGYTDLAHFSKQFKLIMGISPSFWKKEQLRKRGEIE